MSSSVRASCVAVSAHDLALVDLGLNDRKLVTARDHVGDVVTLDSSHMVELHDGRREPASAIRARYVLLGGYKDAGLCLVLVLALPNTSNRTVSVLLVVHADLMALAVLAVRPSGLPFTASVKGFKGQLAVAARALACKKFHEWSSNSHGDVVQRQNTQVKALGGCGFDSHRLRLFRESNQRGLSSGRASSVSTSKVGGENPSAPTIQRASSSEKERRLRPRVGGSSPSSRTIYAPVAQEPSALGRAPARPSAASGEGRTTQSVDGGRSLSGRSLVRVQPGAPLRPRPKAASNSRSNP